MTGETPMTTMPGHHPMVPADYTTPDNVRALDDAVRIGGALSGLLLGLAAFGAGVRRWWHRKRDRQEKVITDAVGAMGKRFDELEERLEDRLREVHDEVREIRSAQIRHLEQHAT